MHNNTSIIVPEKRKETNVYKHCNNISLDNIAIISTIRKEGFLSHFETDFLILRQIIEIYEEKVPQFLSCST